MEHDIFFLHFFPAAASKMNYQSYYVVILELICPLTTKVKSVEKDTLVVYSLAELMSAFAKIDWGKIQVVGLEKKNSCTVFENYLKSHISKYSNNKKCISVILMKLLCEFK